MNLCGFVILINLGTMVAPFLYVLTLNLGLAFCAKKRMCCTCQQSYLALFFPCFLNISRCLLFVDCYLIYQWFRIYFGFYQRQLSLYLHPAITQKFTVVSKNFKLWKKQSIKGLWYTAYLYVSWLRRNLLLLIQWLWQRLLLFFWLFYQKSE